jgi:hypothetical protein
MKFDFKVKIRNQIFAYANSVRKKREKGKKRRKKGFYKGRRKLLRFLPTTHAA